MAVAADLLLAGLSILMIGDSHLTSPGYLITSLQDGLVQNGARVVTYAARGLPAEAWVTPRQATYGTGQRTQSGPIKITEGPAAHSWAVDDLIRQHHPDLIVVQLGDTMAGYAQPALPRAWIQQQVLSLTAKIAATNTPCIWVGPHWGTEGGAYGKSYAKAAEMAGFLGTLVTPCFYLNSTSLSQPGAWPTFDGLHYTQRGYQLWGEALTRAIIATPLTQSLRKR